MRSNQEWEIDLRAEGPRQAEALEELREILLRGALYTFTHNLADLQALGDVEIQELAEDCAQEALIRILANLDSFRGESKFTTWAYKFAINIALTTSRRERWKGISLDAITEEDSFPDELIPVYQAVADPDRTALQNEAWKTLHDIMRQELSPRQQQVIQWMVFDEVPMDVVVERMGTNRNAVYKLLHDARRNIKHQLEERGFQVLEVIHLFGG